MPVWHGTWKASEPLSDLVQLPSIAKHDPNVNAEHVVSVSNTQQPACAPSAPHLAYEVPAGGRCVVALMKGLIDTSICFSILYLECYPLCVRIIFRWRAACRRD